MNPSKSAEEVVDAVFAQEHPDATVSMRQLWINAITEYAEARVKEAQGKLIEQGMKDIEITRNEALEEAAKVAETFWDHIPQEEFDRGFEYDHFTVEDITRRIRALKSKPCEEEK